MPGISPAKISFHPSRNWASVSSMPSDERSAAKYSASLIYHRHETGEISDAEYFAALRSSLGIELTDAQFLEGWNEIFAGEMPGIAVLLRRAARRLPLYA